VGRKAPTKAERAYMSAAAAGGCILCEWRGVKGTPAELHHPRTGTGAALRASHWEVAPLCVEHHRGNTGVHGLGRKAFERHYGITELELVGLTKLRTGQQMP
jgi:hypothetical protein